MKRRSFLSLLGAAIATPALPAAAPAASYSRLTFGIAVLHARTRAHVSARGLAWCLKVPLPQAKAMLSEMAARGMVTPVGLSGQMRAVSNILQPQAWHVAGQPADPAASKTKAMQPNAPDTTPELPGWLRHLRGVARAEGHRLQTARIV